MIRRCHPGLQKLLHPLGSHDQESRIKPPRRSWQGRLKNPEKSWLKKYGDRRVFWYRSHFWTQCPPNSYADWPACRSVPPFDNFLWSYRPFYLTYDITSWAPNGCNIFCYSRVVNEVEVVGLRTLSSRGVIRFQFQAKMLNWFQFIFPWSPRVSKDYVHRRVHISFLGPEYEYNCPLGEVNMGPYAVCSHFIVSHVLCWRPMLCHLSVRKAWSCTLAIITTLRHSAAPGLLFSK